MKHQVDRGAQWIFNPLSLLSAHICMAGYCIEVCILPAPEVQLAGLMKILWAGAHVCQEEPIVLRHPIVPCLWLCCSMGESARCYSAEMRSAEKTAAKMCVSQCVCLCGCGAPFKP